MRKKVFIAAVFALAITLGCGGGSSEPVNSIKIESISPESANAGESTTFTITVSYNLQTADSGVIDYCFSGAFFGDRWQGCPVSIPGITVSRGRGTITFEDTQVLTETSDLSVFLRVTDDATSDVQTVNVIQ